MPFFIITANKAILAEVEGREGLQASIKRTEDKISSMKTYVVEVIARVLILMLETVNVVRVITRAYGMCACRCQSPVMGEVYSNFLRAAQHGYVKSGEENERNGQCPLCKRGFGSREELNEFISKVCITLQSCSRLCYPKYLPMKRRNDTVTMQLEKLRDSIPEKAGAVKAQLQAQEGRLREMQVSC